MRAPAAIVVLLSAAGTADAQSPLAAEVRALADRYHENPAPIAAPSNADWSLKGSREARRLAALPGRS